GNVTIQTYRHADFTSGALSGRQLLGREPLQIFEVLDVLGTLAREALNCRRGRIAILLWPTRPAPILRTLQAQLSVERIVDGVQAQRSTLEFLELPECLRSQRIFGKMTRAKVRVQQGKDFELRRRDTHVVDVLGGTQLFQRSLKFLLGDPFARRLAL